MKDLTLVILGPPVQHDTKEFSVEDLTLVVLGPPVQHDIPEVEDEENQYDILPHISHLLCKVQSSSKSVTKSVQCPSISL